MPAVKDFSPFVPFDLYDFFGYLFPGVIFSTSILIFYNQLHPGFYNKWFSYPTNEFEIPFIVGLGFVVAAIVVLYSLGHVIATLSHIIIDRVLIDGIEGYPINFLLDIPRISREYSEATFKYLFAFFNILLFLPALPIYYTTYKLLSKTVIAIIVFLIVQRFIIMLIRRRPEGHDLANKMGNKKIFRSFLFPSKWLIDPWIDFFRKLLGMDRRFSSQFISLFKQKFSDRFGGLKSNQEGSDNYWLSEFSVTSRDDIHDRTIQTWLHLYGFARNVSASIYLSSFLIICHIYFNPRAFSGLVPLQLGFQWILAAIFGIRYWILYSHYYSKGVIRAFIELETRK